MTPEEELDATWRFEVAIQDAVARERVEVAWGTALRSPDLPGVYDANFARVDSRVGEVGAEEIVAELDRTRGDLWFDKLLVPDDVAGRRLRPGLEGAGFESTPLAVLAYRGDGVGDGGLDAREVSRDEAHATRIAVNTEELPPEASEFAPAIARLQDRIAEEIPATHVFAAPADGEIGALCSLYVIEGVAQIEEVSTLRSRRREGLGRAVVRGALRAALDAAPELVFILAEEENWTRDWYRREGFEQIGRRWGFTRTGAPARATP